jgi:hypothetical protein
MRFAPSAVEVLSAILAVMLEFGRVRLHSGRQGIKHEEVRSEKTALVRRFIKPGCGVWPG